MFRTRTACSTDKSPDDVPIVPLCVDFPRRDLHHTLAIRSDDPGRPYLCHAPSLPRRDPLRADRIPRGNTPPSTSCVSRSLSLSRREARGTGGGAGTAGTSLLPRVLGGLLGLSAVTPGPGLHVRGPSSLGEASARRPGDARASDSLSSSLGAAFAFDAVAVTRGRAGGSAAGSARCGCGSSSSVQYEYEPSSSSFGFLFLSLPPMAPAEVRTTKNKLNATKSRNNML